MSTTAEDLPQELWTQVLQHVDYRQLLLSCALVSQKLARAAAAATQSVSISSPGQLDAFLGWASSHGSSLTSLHLSDMPDSTVIRQLPCANLRELELSRGSLQLGASSEHLGLLHSCTALTGLILRDSTVVDGLQDGPAEVHHVTLTPDTLSGLVNLTPSLTRLRMDQVSLPAELDASQLLQLLARLPALQVLELYGCWLYQQQLSAYSALTASSNLQKLQMDFCTIPTAAWAHAIPAGRKLPQLHSISAVAGSFGSADIARLVSCCPAFKDLHFTSQPDASLAPFKSLTALTQLELCECTLRPACISELTAVVQLRSLRLYNSSHDEPYELQQLAPLTALTRLIVLYATGIKLKSKAPAGEPPDVWVQLLVKYGADIN